MIPSSFPLSSSFLLPSRGLGTWRSENLKETIKTAIELGYRHIDTASMYKNEETIGEVLEDFFNSGQLKREEIFITTKIWNDEKEDVEGSLKRSLKKLKLDYVDLYLIHWPMGYYDKENKLILKPLYKTWREMEECVRKKLCRSIGVSNFNVQLLLDLLSYAEIKPAVNQIEVNPYYSRANLVKFCQEFNIQVVGFQPFCRLKIDVLNDPVIVNLAQKYKKKASQIILNWSLSRGVAVIPKSENKERLKENLECIDFVIEKEDMEKINEMNRNQSSNDRVVKEDFRIPIFD